ncbi:MAG: RNA polymerase sigma factor [Bacilli bacterium]
MANYDAYIEGLKQKDEQTFEFIYQETKATVYAIIVAIVKDRDASQDVMQDTYICMLEKINQYQIGRNFLSWLAAIARNKAIDYYRRKQKETLIDVQESDHLLPTIEPKGERSAMVSEMLALLSDIERQIFLLHIMQNLPHKEVARIVDLPLGTTLWHYNKAIKKIKKVKGSEGNENK